MSDLDRDLAHRLERLAAAVPIYVGQLDPVHRGAVEARHRVRMAWLTPLVALTLVALVIGVIGVGPFNAVNSPVSATTMEGPFELTITSAKARYEAGEAVQIEGSLTYHGAGSSVQVFDALGSGFGADGTVEARFVHFGVVEPVPVEGGSIALSAEVSRLMCDAGVLQPEVPYVGQFTKTFGTSLPIPPGWVHAPLRLPAGTWHPYAVAWVGLEGCDQQFQLRVELPITVIDGSPSTDEPTTPQPTETADPTADLPTPSAPVPSEANHPLDASTVSGDFKLAVFAPTSTFAADEDIDINAQLSYLGADGSVRIGVGAPGLVWYSIAGVHGDDPLLTMDCRLRDLRGDSPFVAKLSELVGGPRQLRLPSGRYEITVTASFDRGICAQDPVRIQTTFEIAVTEGPNDLALWTDPTGPASCDFRANTGTLVRDAESGLAVDLGSGTRKTIWPDLYSGTLVNGVATLFGADGAVLAHEGDVIRFGGGFPDIGPIRPCGGIEVLDADGLVWPVPLETADPPAAGGPDLCWMARGEGILARNPRTGMGFTIRGVPQDVLWPSDYTAWIEDGVAVLRNGAGTLVAREGDHVVSGGGFGADGRWFACSGVTVIS